MVTTVQPLAFAFVETVVGAYRRRVARAWPSFFAGCSIFDKAEEIKWSLVDPRDLGALEAKAGHQTLLIEGEGIDTAMQSTGGEAAGHPFVHDDDARAGANLLAARVVYPVQRLLVHEKEGVTVLLNAGFQAIRGGYGPVATPGLSVHEKYSFAPLRTKDEAGLDYIRKNKNGHCFRFNFGCRRILRYELLQSATGVTSQIVGGRCVSAE